MSVWDKVSFSEYSLGLVQTREGGWALRQSYRLWKCELFFFGMEFRIRGWGRGLREGMRRSYSYNVIPTRPIWRTRGVIYSSRISSILKYESWVCDTVFLTIFCHKTFSWIPFFRILSCQWRVVRLFIKPGLAHVAALSQPLPSYCLLLECIIHNMRCGGKIKDCAEINQLLQLLPYPANPLPLPPPP